ncbi:MAG: hypothetical protein KDA41_06570, partial [Planctomycetales bacterium]|nr:hypothetical protein [Planctomycetales bacterium]
MLRGLAARQLAGSFQAFAHVLVGDDFLAGNLSGAFACGGDGLGEATRRFLQGLRRPLRFGRLVSAFALLTLALLTLTLFALSLLSLSLLALALLALALLALALLALALFTLALFTLALFTLALFTLALFTLA